MAVDTSALKAEVNRHEEDMLTTHGLSPEGSANDRGFV